MATTDASTNTSVARSALTTSSDSLACSARSEFAMLARTEIWTPKLTFSFRAGSTLSTGLARRSPTPLVRLSRSAPSSLDPARVRSTPRSRPPSFSSISRSPLTCSLSEFRSFNLSLRTIDPLAVLQMPCPPRSPSHVGSLSRGRSRGRHLVQPVRHSLPGQASLRCLMGHDSRSHHRLVVPWCVGCIREKACC